MVANDNNFFCFLFHSFHYILLATMVIKNKELRKIIAGRKLKDFKEVDNFNDCHFVIVKNLNCRQHSLILTIEEYEEKLEMEVYNYSTVFFLCWTNPEM